MIGKTISHYRILEKLGEGGMGVVYKAEDTRLRRTVALKFLSPHATGTDVNRARFVHEAMAAAGLDHPGICTVYEIDEADGQVFIAMALVEGRSLEDRIAEGPLGIGETIDIAIKVADGLASAHEKGVVHRDIKPGNIMATDRGRVKIMDFGLARFAACTTLTSPGATVGTVPYMSPEQATGRDLDQRTDIWSLGAVMYEMLTGLRPFRGDSSPAVVYSIVKEEPEPVTGLRTGIPIELERIVLKAMAKDPDERYQTAADLIADLSALRRRLGLGSRTGSALTRPVAPSGPRRANLRRRRLVPAVVAVAASITLIWLSVLPRRIPADGVVVVPLENRAADASLGHVGQLAAEAITEGLSQTAVVRVVPAVSARRQERAPESAAPAPLTMDEIRAIAARAGAGTVVTGAYYTEGALLRLRIRVTNAARRELIYAFTDIAGPLSAPSEAIDAASQRVMGLLATGFDPVLDSQPPTYEAYREFMTGMELWSSGFTASAEHFVRASKLDSAYFWPRLMAAHAFSLADREARADSLFRGLENERERLTPFERLNLDWSRAFVHQDFAEGLRRLRQVDDMLAHSRADKPLFRMSLKRVLGLHAILLNRPREALAAFEGLLELWEDWRPQAMRGGTTWELWAFQYECTALHMLGEHRRELREAQRAVELYPDDLALRLCELRAMAALGRIGEADSVFEDAMTLRSESDLAGWFAVQAADVMRAQGHRQEGVKLSERAAAILGNRLQPGESTSEDRQAVGEVLYAAERWDEARDIFEQLVREEPENVDCRAFLGALAARRGDSTAATAASEWLMGRKHPSWSGRCTYQRARIAALLGDEERAVELLRDALAAGSWMFYDLGVFTDMDLESLRDYPPFQEFIRPKG